MVKIPHPDKSEDVECFILDNDGLTINHTTLRKSGNVIYDDMVSEAYLIVSKPRIVNHDRKTRVGYLLDRDKGITYDMIREATGDQVREKVEIATLQGAPKKDWLGRDSGDREYKLVGCTIEIERDPGILRLFTTPQMLGRILSSEFISRIIDLKPVRWQLIVVGVFAFFLGYAF